MEHIHSYRQIENEVLIIKWDGTDNVVNLINTDMIPKAEGHSICRYDSDPNILRISHKVVECSIVRETTHYARIGEFIILDSIKILPVGCTIQTEPQYYIFSCIEEFLDKFYTKYID